MSKGPKLFFHELYHYSDLEELKGWRSEFLKPSFIQKFSDLFSSILPPPFEDMFRSHSALNFFKHEFEAINRDKSPTDVMELWMMRRIAARNYLSEFELLERYWEVSGNDKYLVVTSLTSDFDWGFPEYKCPPVFALIDLEDEPVLRIFGNADYYRLFPVKGADVRLIHRIEDELDVYLSEILNLFFALQRTPRKRPRVNLMKLSDSVSDEIVSNLVETTLRDAIQRRSKNPEIWGVEHLPSWVTKMGHLKK